MYQVTRAYRAVGEFLNEDLSNWYVRRSRGRFWGSGESEDSRAAFRTLWEILVDLSRIVAPVTPFAADWIHRALTDESVHLATFPAPTPDLVDRELEEGMDAVRGSGFSGEGGQGRGQDSGAAASGEDVCRDSGWIDSGRGASGASEG